MAVGRVSRLDFYNKSKPARDPNVPYWKCEICKFWNSDLRNTCIKCEKGKKHRFSKRSILPTVRRKKKAEHQLLDLILKSGIVGMNESELIQQSDLPFVRPTLNELRVKQLIFHDLTDNRWKPIEFKPKDTNDLSWKAG